MRMLLIVATGVLLASCNESKKSGNSAVPRPMVSIATDLENITSANAANFMLSGTCSENGQPVTVVVGEGEEGLSPEAAPTCTNGAWTAEVDVSSLNEGASREISITADHASSGGQSATQATGTVLLPPRVSLATDLAEITSTNLANFTVSGTCSEEGESITVVVGEGGLSPGTAPTCTNGAWMAEVNLTHITGPSREVSITADHVSSGGQSATQATSSTLLHPRVTIDADSVGITLANAGSFTVSGTCSEEGEEVAVSVGTVSATPTCATGGTWTTEVDMSGLTGDSRPIAITADHATSGDTLEATQATGSVIAYLVFSMDTLADITSANAGSFTVSGSCLEEGQPVTVVVGEGAGSVSPGTNPDCTNGAWTIDMDVTGLNKTEGDTSVTADHSPATGSAHSQQTQTVTNNFTCPTNYVGVPALASYTTNSFCVMKYEAKSDESDMDADDDMDTNNAVAQATGLPYVSINRADSITKCTGLNSSGENKHDLITNDEWQSLARNIELVPSNWATGVVGNAGGLSTGHSDAVPNNTLAASSDDTKGCEGTGQTCSNTTWDSQRRTHTLSNGEVIWDIAGNVWEWMKDTNNSIYHDYAGYISYVTAASAPISNSLSGGTTTTSRNAKDQFGPSGDYTSLRTWPFGGLGYGYINFNAGGVIRGGRWYNSSGYSPGGVFMVALDPAPTSVWASLGFRCAFHP